MALGDRPIPEGYGQVNYKFSSAGLPRGAEVTLGYFAGPESVASNCTVYREAFETHIMDQLGLTIVLQEVLAVQNDGGNMTTDTQVSGQVGAIDEPQVSSQVCMIVRKRTALSGRANRGRWYLPGCVEPNVGADGRLTAPYKASLQAALDDYFDVIKSVFLFPVIIHAEPQAGPPIPDPTDITSMVVGPIVRTQRHRLPRV